MNNADQHHYVENVHEMQEIVCLIQFRISVVQGTASIQFFSRKTKLYSIVCIFYRCEYDFSMTDIQGKKAKFSYSRVLPE